MIQRIESPPPRFFPLVTRFGATLNGALRNRIELMTVEWQEEKKRLAEMLVWVVAFLFVAVMAMGLLTSTIVLLCPQEVRVYVAGGFTLLYVGAAIALLLGLRKCLAREPFAETVNQLKRDGVWLDSLK